MLKKKFHTKNSPEVPCINLQRQNSAMLFKKLFNRNIPFKIISSNKPKPQKFEFLLQKIFSLQQFKEEDTVDVMMSADKNYDNKRIISIEMTPNSFINDNSKKNLYLAQFPLFNKLNQRTFYNKKKAGKLLKKRISKSNFINRLEFNNFLLGLEGFDFSFVKTTEIFKDLNTCNIWANKKKSRSLLHYDFYENFLYCLCGEKKVFLFPPDSKAVINPDKTNLYFHQGKLEIPKGTSNNKLNFYKLNGLKKIILKAGEVLRIPEGWHHQIISKPKTIALNFWFESIFEKILQIEKPIFERLLRRQMESRVKKVRNAYLAKRGLKKVSSDKVKKFILNSLLEKKLDLNKILEGESIGPQIYLDYLLTKLETSDSKVNALEFLASDEKLSQINRMSNDRKEYFYKFFAVYFREKEQKKCLEIREMLENQIRNQKIENLFN